MQKKGQFTILVIFGILAVLVVGIVLFMASSVQEQTTEQQAEEAVTEFLQANALRSYVESCLQSVSEQAIHLAGWQGGNIWTYQNGSIDPESEPIPPLSTDYQSTEKFNISYAVQDLNYAGCPVLETDPGPYPYAYTSGTGILTQSQVNARYVGVSGSIVSMFNSVPPHRSPNITSLNGGLFSQVCPYYADEGFFGVRTTRNLCTYQGPNWKGDTDRPSLYSTCEGRYDYKENNPVQFQLKNYTENHLLKCANFKRLQQVGGFRVDVVNKPKINYTFGREDVTVNALYPVKVSKEGNPPVELQIDFSHTINARFKELYEFFNDLAMKEATNSSFNGDPQASQLYREGFHSTIVPNCCNEEPEDSMLRVWDDNSIIQGRTLTIQGVVKNRAPVLGYVPKINFTITEDSTVQITLNLSKHLQDPDGDSIEAQFWGFKGDEFTINWDPATKTTTAYIRAIDWSSNLQGCTSNYMGVCVQPPLQRFYTYIEVSDPYGGSDFQYEGLELEFNVECSGSCEDPGGDPGGGSPIVPPCPLPPCGG